MSARKPIGKRTKAGVLVGAVAGGLMLASPQLLDFLGDWEGRGRTVYADKLAGGLPTACGGLTNHTSSKPVIVGEVWTEEECAAGMSEVVTAGQLKLADCFTRQPPQHVFNAFSSHEHNFGVAATCGSQAMAAFNAGDTAAACRLIAYTPDGKPNWSSVKTGRTLPNGKPELRFVQGLQNRRLAEMAMCEGRK
ncbi:MAG: lysozyme [Roseateles sp.]|uniref:lysozyme n=1 Tax=Roseateles sp. TaxID=1971397 RepID=UPI004035753A